MRIKEKYLGKTGTNKQGRTYEIVDYVPANKQGHSSAYVVARFEDGVVVKCDARETPFHPDDKPKPAYKVGDRVQSNRFGWATVTAYISNKNVEVEFDCGGGTRANVWCLQHGYFAPSGALRANTQSLWLEKAKSLHGDKYCYSESIFTKYNEKIDIHCNTCERVFSIVASRHISKEAIGCPSCAISEAIEKSRLPVEEFIRRAGDAHCAKYTYNLSTYKGASHPVEIVCPICGVYTAVAGEHMKGGGECPQCAKRSRWTNKASEVKKQDYILLSVTDDKHVWLLHNKCGTSFKASLRSYAGNARFLCPTCGIQNITFDVFKERAAKMFGGEYEYTNFISMADPVTILHKTCGNTFTMKASTHIQGNYGKGVGCAYCAKHGFSVGRDAFIYVLSASNGYVKAGVTHQTEGGRLRQINRTTRKLGWEFSEEYSVPVSGAVAKEVETLTHKYLGEQYEHPEEWFDGRLETYKGVSVEEVINLIEKFLQEELSKN